MLKKTIFLAYCSASFYLHKISIDICDALRNLVPFAQLKKGEKHPWSSVNASADKTTGGAIKSKIMLSQQSFDQLHKPIIRKYTLLLKIVYRPWCRLS